MTKICNFKDVFQFLHFQSFILFLCGVGRRRWHILPSTYKSQKATTDLVLSFNHMCSRNPTQVIGLERKSLYSLNHLASGGVLLLIKIYTSQPYWFGNIFTIKNLKNPTLKANRHMRSISDKFEDRHCLFRWKLQVKVKERKWLQSWIILICLCLPGI